MASAEYNLVWFLISTYTFLISQWWPLFIYDLLNKNGILPIFISPLYLLSRGIALLT